MLDQAGVDRYIRSFYARLSRDLAHAPEGRRDPQLLRRQPQPLDRHREDHQHRAPLQPRTKFWFTETGAMASFGGSFPYSESRQAARMRNMFTFASRYRAAACERVYSYNFFGVENGDVLRHAGAASTPGLVDPDGTPRPVFAVFKAEARELLALSARGAPSTSAGASTSGSSAPRPEISSTRSIWRGPRQIDSAMPASPALRVGLGERAQARWSP